MKPLHGKGTNVSDSLHKEGKRQGNMYSKCYKRILCLRYKSRQMHLCWVIRVEESQHYWKPTWVTRGRADEAWQFVHSHEGKQNIACYVKQEPTHHGFESAQACIRNVPVERKKLQIKSVNHNNQNDSHSQRFTLMISVNREEHQQLPLSL